MELPEELAGRSPEEVLAFVREADDDALRAAVHGIGTPVVLDLLFTGMAGRFEADPRRRAARLAFVLEDDGVEHERVLELDAQGARVVAPGPRARATLRATLVRFLRVAAGAADPKWMFLTGALRIGGDPLWAARTLGGMSSPGRPPA